MPTKSIVIAYGYSGDGLEGSQDLNRFPDGSDKNRSFQLVAETLKTTVMALGPTPDTYQILVRSCWSKDRLIAAINEASHPIEQLHICCHGISGWLSLAFGYGSGVTGGWRLKNRAGLLVPSQATLSAEAWASKAISDEDALVSGYFDYAIAPARRTELRKRFDTNAYCQVWGCYAGDLTAYFTGFEGDPVLDKYFKGLNRALPQIDGMIVDIAKGLGIECTAAYDGGGLSFWHRDAGGQIKINDGKVPRRRPFWLWNAPNSKWRTVDKTGTPLSSGKVRVFNKLLDPGNPMELPAGQPPKWLTDLYT